MIDIVERLRDNNRFVGEDLYEAADEIERLRRLVKAWEEGTRIARFLREQQNER